MATKETNPKEAMGSGKIPFHAIPSKPLMEVGLAMMEGGRKYGTHNYRKAGVRFSTYYNSTLRHMVSYWEGEDIDPDSGVHHIIKAIAGLFVVRDSMHMGNFLDDRPLQYPDGIDMEKFNKMAVAILEKYPECKTPFLQTDVVKEEIKAVGLEDVKQTTALKEVMDEIDDTRHKEYCQHPKCIAQGVPDTTTGKFLCKYHIGYERP